MGFFNTKEITDEFIHDKFNIFVGFVRTRKVKSNNLETSQLVVLNDISLNSGIIIILTSSKSTLIGTKLHQRLLIKIHPSTFFGLFPCFLKPTQLDVTLN